MAIDKPWAAASDREAGLLPDPVLGVLASLADRLAGRRVVGRLPLAEGVECMIFEDGKGGGMLAAWNESAGEEDAEIDIHLGGKPVAIDVWGNRWEVPSVDGRHRVAVGTTPVFIEGIDPRLALLRASFEVDPSFIESSAVPHRHTMRFMNPWREPLRGKMRVTGPKGWGFSPSIHQFTVGPGAERGAADAGDVPGV